jgi:long-chain acyl-CoA synthetase
MNRADRTIPSMYHAQVARFAHRVFAYHKDAMSGRWLATTWSEAYDTVKAISNALMSFGIQRGDRVGIVSETRPEWSAADLGIVCAGAITVGVYPTSTAEQSAYVLEHSGAGTVFVEDRRQLAKLLEVRDLMPSVHRFIVFDGVQGLPDGVLSAAELEDRGAAYAAANPEAFTARWQSIRPEDLAMLVYTSGTTGHPKGVMLSHKNIVATVDAANLAIPMRDDDLGIIFLPLAHSFQRTANYAAMEAGGTGVFAERLDKIVDHMREFRPTLQAAVPRVYEKIHQRILATVADLPPRRRAVFMWAVDVGKRARALEREGKPVPLPLRIQFEAADRLVLGKIRDVFGSRLRFMVSGAAPIGRDILEFFHACGIIILEGWGLTETSGPATVNRLDRLKFGSVGLDLACCETKIAADGEILIRGDNVFSGYYRDPDATREAFTEDGWFKTGDIGTKDAAGFVFITDRKKELIITAGGKNLSPANIESAVKAHSLVGQCVVFGDRRKYLVALIALNEDALPELASKLRLDAKDTAALARHPKVIGEVQLVVDSVNRELARYETIKHFRILDREMTPEDDLLTPTLKLKRRNIEARYSHLIDEMYEVASTDERRESLW